MLCAGLIGLFSQSTFAEITVLEKTNAFLAPLSLEIGGSIRPQFIWNNGDEPDYYKNGHDGGTRFRFGADYAINSRSSLIGYYELGVDIPHVLKWDGHYDTEGKRDYQRQLYGGIKDSEWGTLTFGHQYGVYYDTIGAKSDMWDNDGHASANWIGINGDYDGGERPKNTVKYTNTFGNLTLRADYLLPQDETPAGNDLRYRRHHGGGIGIDYQLQQDLTFSAAWNETRASVKSPDGQRQRYTQQYSGAALTWQPNRWYLVTTATYYNNYVPSKRQQTAARYFAGDGYGLESFVGYTFAINRPWLSAIQPYIAADTLRLKGDEDYHAHHVYLGMSTQLAYGFSFWLERTMASSSDQEPDTTWLSIYYDF
ncbi:porin [Enterobacteriaceae bacterium 4M9]|nr:porin [Enterobacteriaceae bacterium 4M9]